MSITTKGGDRGETSLPGGARVPKSDARVDAYGTIDELISVMGLGRALCPNAEIRELTKQIQKELFGVGGALAAEPGAEVGVDAGGAPLDPALVERLTDHVHRIEALPGLLDDWALPGEDAAAAAYDVARTVCRRAERLAVGLEGVSPTAVAYLNRLSDLLWLLGRQIEKEAGVDGRLRESGGRRWSKAW